jgi:hypothetical protein
MKAMFALQAIFLLAVALLLANRASAYPVVNC